VSRWLDHILERFIPNRRIGRELRELADDIQPLLDARIKIGDKRFDGEDADGTSYLLNANEEIHSFIDYNELGLALEHLELMIIEGELEITSVQKSRLEKLASEMGMKVSV